MKKIIAAVVAASLLSGCASPKPVTELSTIELCGEYGYNMKMGDLKRFSAVKNELDKRNDVTLEDCKAYATVGLGQADAENQHRNRAATISAAMMKANATMNAGNNVSNAIRGW